MAFLKRLFGAGNAKPDFTGLQVQTSVSTLPVPIVWGQTKVAVNVFFYANFQTSGGGGGKGGLFSQQSSTYTYSADLMMALCEGPIYGIGVDLERPVDLHAVRSQPQLFQRQHASDDVGLSGLQLSRPGARLSGNGLCLRCELRVGRQCLGRQP